MNASSRILIFISVIAVGCASVNKDEPSNHGQAMDRKAVVAPGYEMTPGVVVVPAEGVVYVALPAGGVGCLDSATGSVNWVAAEVSSPLISVAGLVLARREHGSGLPLAVLDAATGEVRHRIDALLPDGIQAPLNESIRVKFSSRTRLAGETAFIEWEYLERDPVGTSPVDGRPFARRLLGILEVDLEGGTVKALDRNATDEREKNLPATISRLLESGESRRKPWRVGDLLVATQQHYGPGAERLVLMRWRATDGEAFPDVELQPGRAVAVLPAADGEHLLAVSAVSDSAKTTGSYRWTVYSSRDGRAVFRGEFERSASPFCLLGNLLISVQPPSAIRTHDKWVEKPMRIEALDIQTNAEVWSLPLRDFMFRGPAPPRP